MTSSRDDTPDRELIAKLEEQCAQLNEAMASRTVEDQAVGLVVALGRVSSGQGWIVLEDISQRTGLSLRQVAELIVAWGHSGDIPEDIRAVLEDALDRRGPRQTPGHGA
ncbi:MULTISPECIES: ANTAR domain-containing protein [unclassified Streptomyces]|uniref:ANTAR domain-containing protein n=1 Tax=unclassified Streptomyces TaxID=2593676 RepID=UPI0024733776|nr:MULTISPECIES: ANTAR domain-containing protein [unclassified Streptomyces]